MNEAVKSLLDKRSNLQSMLRRNNITTDRETEDEALTTSNTSTPIPQPHGTETPMHTPLRSIGAQYDMTRKQTFYESETVTISPNDDEHVTITVETPTTTVSFNVRISGYTTRFGTLDAEYISVGSLSASVYYKRPDTDGYLSRNLFYYRDVNGVGGENTWEDASEPLDPLWEREDHFGKTVSGQNSSATRLEVYDWREEMLTHNKPTPSEGEVVIKYVDSTLTGGGRDGTYNVIKAGASSTDTRSDQRGGVPLTAESTPSGMNYLGQYITFNPDNGKLELYADEIDGKRTCKMLLTPDTENTTGSWEERTEPLPHPNKVKNVIWTRKPEHTWFVKTNSTLIS